MKRTPPYNFNKLQTGIARGLQGVNVALSTTPITVGDRFDDVEILIISTTAAAQAENDLWLRRTLMLVLERGGTASLLGLCALIVARRLARHGILLPGEFDAQVREFLNSTLNAVHVDAQAAMQEEMAAGLQATPSDAAPVGA